MAEKPTHELTAADVAALVFRDTPRLDKDGKPGRADKIAIGADEVLAWRDYGDHVVVVTTDGQKFSGAKKAGK